MLHSHKHINKIHKKKRKQKQHHIVLAASVVYPLSTLPQIYEVFHNQSAANLSVLTYIFYVVFSCIFLVYGLSERLKPIILLQSMWLSMYTILLIGIFMYI